MSDVEPNRPELDTGSTAHGDVFQGPLAWFAQNPVAANLIMLVSLVGGIAALLAGPKQEVFPELAPDLVVINVPYPGASPEEVEEGVALVVEESVQGLDGVKEVTSTSLEGVAVISVELLTGADRFRVLNDVKSAVDRIASFPADIERPVVGLAESRRQVVSLVLHGNIENAEHVLHDLAEQVRYELLDQDEITYVEIDGTRPIEMSVDVSGNALREHGMTLTQVAAAIRAASVEIPAGTLRTSSGDILLRTTERRHSAEEFGSIVLRSRPDGSVLRVRDLAEIQDGFREMDEAARFNGEHAVRLDVYRIGEEEPLEVSAAVRSYAEGDLLARLPPGVSADLWSDSSETYALRIDLLKRNAEMGLILVMLVLALFIEPRLAFWVTLGIPVSFAGSLLVLPLLGVTVNMVTLFGFIVVLGMVVDDAIVVGEAIHDLRVRGIPPMEAAIRGVREVAVPVIFSVLTTVISFAPLLFVPGVSGKFFRSIPLVVISVLLISLTEALLVLPSHLSHRMPWWLRILLAPILLPSEWVHRLKAEQWLLRVIESYFKPVVQWAIRMRYITFSIAIAMLLGTCAIPKGGHLKFTFMPKVEGDTITANVRMPIGTPASVSEEIEERLVETAKAVLAEHGGERILRGIYSRVGSSSGSGGAMSGGSRSQGAHLSGAMVYLVQSDQRNITSSQFAEAWRERLGDIAGAENVAFNFNTGASAGAPVDIQLSHPNVEVLEDAAQRLADALHAYPGLRDIDSGVSSGKEQFDVRLSAEGRARGLTETDLARQLRDSFFGAEASRQQRGREELRVYVRRPLEERNSVTELESLIVRTPDGGEMPLLQAAVISRGRAYTSIRRVAGKRIVSVTADVVAGVGNASEIVRQVQERELAALVSNTPGLSFSLGGEQKDQKEAMMSLARMQGIAFLVMFVVLAVVFRSFTQPLIVMLGAIPFGVTGAFLGHLLLGYDLSIISIMGLVALSGVTVNSAIVLIDAVNAFRTEGMTSVDAVVAASTRRFRPILLTTLTTFLGLAPMILEPSVQARFLIPMAISLGFGVMFSMIVVSLVVPAAYLIVEDLTDGISKLFASTAALFDDDDETATPH